MVLAFNAWHAHASEKASNRERLSMCVSRMVHLKLWQILNKWKEAVLVSDACQERAELMLQKLQAHQQARLFYHWHEHALRQHSLELKVSHGPSNP